MNKNYKILCAQIYSQTNERTFLEPTLFATADASGAEVSLADKAIDEASVAEYAFGSSLK